MLGHRDGSATGPRLGVLPRRGEIGGRALVTGGSHGVSSRRPVFSGSRRVPGLYERTLASGATVWEVRQRLGGGRLRRVRLQATTKSDAIVEQRALLVDHARGEASRSPAVGLTLAE